MRDKHNAGSKEMCSTDISFGRSKLLQSCSNFMLEPELEPTVLGQRCSGGFYTGFVQKLSSNSKRLQFLPDIWSAYIYTNFFHKKWKKCTVLNELMKLSTELFNNCLFSLNYSRFLLATGLFFMAIVFDEVRPKILCIHTKLIIICHGLRAVRKRDWS